MAGVTITLQPALDGTSVEYTVDPPVLDIPEGSGNVTITFLLKQKHNLSGWSFPDNKDINNNYYYGITLPIGSSNEFTSFQYISPTELKFMDLNNVNRTYNYTITLYNPNSQQSPLLIDPSIQNESER